jgi:acetaldehyde dehydrogenase (acetylating)
VDLTGKADHLPPYATLVDIMKVAEAAAAAARESRARR